VELYVVGGLKRPGLSAARTLSDAIMYDKVGPLARVHGHQQGCRRLIPEGMYELRKMTAAVDRRDLRGADQQ